MWRPFAIPMSWKELAWRTGREMMADDCFGLAAQLAYFFLLALFPALLFLVALLSFVPVHGVLEFITGGLARVAPGEATKLVQDQVMSIAGNHNISLLTVGMLGTIWSTSSGVSAIMDVLNQAYDIQESRSWLKKNATAVGLTIALAVFVVAATVLVLVGPALAERIATWFHLGGAFTLTWKIAQWPIVFILVSLAVAMVFYCAPDAEQEWVWITSGSVLATVLWLLVSIGFRFYVANVGSYNATYGAIGSVIILMTWLYLSSLAVLAGAELNAEIEHASPYGKDPGEKKLGEKKKIGQLAAREYEQHHKAGTLRPAIAAANCDVDEDIPRPAAPAGPRASDWILSGVVLAEAAALTYARLRSRFKRVA
jgi:membrane protein